MKPYVLNQKEQALIAAVRAIDEPKRRTQDALRAHVEEHTRLRFETDLEVEMTLDLLCIHGHLDSVAEQDSDGAPRTWRIAQKIEPIPPAGSPLPRPSAPTRVIVGN